MYKAVHPFRDSMPGNFEVSAIGAALFRRPILAVESSSRAPRPLEWSDRYQLVCIDGVRGSPSDLHKWLQRLFQKPVTDRIEPTSNVQSAGSRTIGSKGAKNINVCDTGFSEAVRDCTYWKYFPRGLSCGELFFHWE